MTCGDFNKFGEAFLSLAFGFFSSLFPRSLLVGNSLAHLQQASFHAGLQTLTRECIFTLSLLNNPASLVHCKKKKISICGKRNGR